MKHSANLIYGIYTCKLLSSVLNGTEPVAMPDGMTLEDLYAFQDEQSVTNMAYVALKKLGFSQTELQSFQDDYKLNILREARFELAGQQVFAALEKAKIKFLPLKGVILKNYYPNPALRTFTDIDLYIGDQTEEVRNLMFSMGYELKSDEGNEHVYIKKPSLHFEMHTDLFPDDYDFDGYFDDPFKHAKLKDGTNYSYEYYPSDFYIHTFAHLYKHFTYGGCGLRQFMDLYILTKKWQLDFEYIEKELRSINLDGFYETVNKLNGFLFDNEKPTEELLEIADYVFNSGTFGTHDHQMGLDYHKDSEKKEQGLKGWKIKYFLHRWQMTVPQMKERYPILKKCILLLPFCHIHKFFRAVFFRRHIIKQQMNDLETMNSDLSDYVEHILEISKVKINGK